MPGLPYRRPTVRVAAAPFPVHGTGGIRLPYGHGAHEAVGFGKRIQVGPIREAPPLTHCVGYTADQLVACAPLDVGGLWEALLLAELQFLAEVGALTTGDELFVAHIRWVSDASAAVPGEIEVFHRTDDLGRVVGIAIGREVYKWLVL